LYSFNSSANAGINATSSIAGNDYALLLMPDTGQNTEYTCGAAAKQAVLGYWGRDIRG
jgi:predicted double-glycine peptidase